MDLSKIFEMQRNLDKHIIKEKGLERKYLVKEKTLALLVELGELANETRCFKFWSNKPASENKVILEEFVDGLHFIISLCLDREITSLNANFITIKYEPNRDLTEDFLNLYSTVTEFKNEINDKKVLEKLLGQYISFGIKLGFTWNQIVQAYVEKNAVNHQRQENGY